MPPLDSVNWEAMNADKETNRTNKMITDSQTYAIIGAAMEVHRTLGHGFKESVYQEALEVELKSQNIPYIKEYATPVKYKGILLGSHYRADFVCFDNIIVELKAVDELLPSFYEQIIHFLKATGFQRGLILNFGSPQLEYKRVVNGWQNPAQPSARIASHVEN